jgi:hypothetical protein
MCTHENTYDLGCGHIVRCLLPVTEVFWLKMLKAEVELCGHAV